MPLTEEQIPPFSHRREGETTAPATAPGGKPPVDVNELIKGLPNQPNPPTTRPEVHPGMLQDAPRPPTSRPDKPPIDIDALEPGKVQAKPPPVDVDETRQPRRPDDVSGDTFIYMPERGEWVRVRGEGDNRQGPAGAQPDVRNIVRERIIAIDYKRLARGDSSQNIVIRPDDRIYVDGPEQGLVYVDGEVVRVGVYSMPTTGEATLSRMITAAGGLGPLAVPEKVDLTRRVAPHREATIRVNLAAIRQRTEPDIVVRPDDHIIVGTTFWATPLAVLRNGFRVTYGFGFLLDRNFGSDVFGAPPGSVSGGG